MQLHKLSERQQLKPVLEYNKSNIGSSGSFVKYCSCDFSEINSYMKWIEVVIILCGDYVEC